MLIRESIKEGIISKSFLDNSFKIGNIIKDLKFFALIEFLILKFKISL